MAGSSSGIIGGMDPLVYSASSPYTLFFFQLLIILGFSHFLHFFLSKIKQPRVISEVLTGIILSHTALGRIPNFTSTVLPTESIQGLTLVANIGLCLLMFIVGCEVDISFIKKHIVTAITVGIFNMAVPFGLGCLCAIGLWSEYRVKDSPKIEFTTFMVFIAVSMCITAFPVLVRILTELRLVKDRVGTVVLAAGITNDLLGWILLALSITLANSAHSMITLYIVLVAVAYCIFICYPVRIGLRYLLVNVFKEFENPNSPSRASMTLIFSMLFASAFFTDILGIHPIFGAFIIGAIVPRENDYVVSLTSRIEDLVNIIFVPVYFAIAGLDVDLGLLKNGVDWGWAFGLIGIALAGKILGGVVAAKLNGLYLRESLTVGILMSCKGIVEIVVLQTGLKAKIISELTYSMFIFMALVTTFLTTPLTLYVYTPAYRETVQARLTEKQKIEKSNEEVTVEDLVGVVESDGNDICDGQVEEIGKEKTKEVASFFRDMEVSKIIISVHDIESISNGLLLLDVFLEDNPLPVHAINLKTLTERTSDILHASMMNDGAHSHAFNSLNAILSILKLFCHFNKIPFTSEILYSLPEHYLKTLFDNQNISKNDIFMLSIPHRHFTIEYLTKCKKEANDYKYNKLMFINNNLDLNENNSNYETEQPENKSLFSENTILNPSALKISSVTLYINGKNLTSLDKLGIKLLNLIIKGKEVLIANIFLTNLDYHSIEFQKLNEWISYNEEKYKNVKFNIRMNKDKDNAEEIAVNTNVHNISIVSSDNNADLKLVQELVSKTEKVIVLL